MQKFAAILSLIAIVACPYECTVKQLVMHTASTESQTGCCEGCCTSESDRSDSEQSPPAQDGDGVWCLCDGAVVDNSARPTIDHLTLLCVSSWSIFPKSTIVDYANPAPSNPASSIFVARDSSFARIALRSLLL